MHELARVQGSGILYEPAPIVLDDPVSEAGNAESAEARRVHTASSSASSASSSSRKLLAGHETEPADLEPLPEVTEYVCF